MVEDVSAGKKDRGSVDPMRREEDGVIDAGVSMAVVADACCNSPISLAIFDNLSTTDSLLRTRTTFQDSSSTPRAA